MCFQLFIGLINTIFLPWRVSCPLSFSRQKTKKPNPAQSIPYSFLKKESEAVSILPQEEELNRLDRSPASLSTGHDPACKVSHDIKCDVASSDNISCSLITSVSPQPIQTEQPPGQRLEAQLSINDSIASNIHVPVQTPTALGTTTQARSSGRVTVPKPAVVISAPQVSVRENTNQTRKTATKLNSKQVLGGSSCSIKSQAPSNENESQAVKSIARKEAPRAVSGDCVSSVAGIISTSCSTNLLSQPTVGSTSMPTSILSSEMQIPLSNSAEGQTPQTLLRTVSTDGPSAIASYEASGEPSSVSNAAQTISPDPTFLNHSAYSDHRHPLTDFYPGINQPFFHQGLQNHYYSPSPYINAGKSLPLYLVEISLLSIAHK